MKQLQPWLLLAVLLVVAVVVWLLTSATPETETRPSPIDCPYPTQTCPYQVDRSQMTAELGCPHRKEIKTCSRTFSATAFL